MVAQICDVKLEEAIKLVLHQKPLVTVVCFLSIVSSSVTLVGNLVVIPVLWKCSTVSMTMKALFLNLAVSDLAIGLLVQQMYIGITVVMLKTTRGTDHDRFDFLCPFTMTIFWFALYLFASSSFLSVAAIALDRLLAVVLHLRYSQLITPKRVLITVVLLWATSTIGATIFILLPGYNDMVAVVLEITGLLATSVAYFHIYRVARRHRNQIHSHLQAQSRSQAVNMARVKTSACNTFYVYIVFLLCWLPSLISFAVKESYGSRVIVIAANYVAGYIVFLHSSINPLIFCWRYREIRQGVIAILRRSQRSHDAVNARRSISALQG